MTLRELLAKSPKRQFNIGSVDGTNWFYCGTGQELLDNGANWLNNLALDICHRHILNSELRVERNKELLLTVTARTPNWQRLNMQKNLKTSQTTLKRYQEYYKNFVPFLDREVVERYWSISEPGAVCVLVKGKEGGNYWNRTETMQNPNQPFSMTGTGASVLTRESASRGGKKAAAQS